MNIQKALVFDIWGDYAHFRRGYTTTSPTTFGFPPRTALTGLIAAILGLPNEKENTDITYYEILGKGKSFLALRILNPIEKVQINLNLIDTKHGFTHWEIQRKGQSPITPRPFQFLKDPKYRIYIWLQDSYYYRKLKELLATHKSKYTAYLGISECIANFRFNGEVQVKEEYTNSIDSIIDTSKATVKIEEGKKYNMDKMPAFMNKNREVEGYINFIYDVSGNPPLTPNPLKIEKNKYWSIMYLSGEKEYVIFF